MDGALGKETIEYLKFAHGGFNLTVFFLFIYQASLGLRIRKARRAKNPPEAGTVKRHRKQGPFFAALALTGYLAGIVIVYLDTGQVIKYPLHFLNGTLIASLITATFLVSRKISGGTEWRRPHFILGLMILSLYVIQALLGLGILL